MAHSLHSSPTSDFLGLIHKRKETNQPAETVDIMASFCRPSPFCSVDVSSSGVPPLAEINSVQPVPDPPGRTVPFSTHLSESPLSIFSGLIPEVSTGPSFWHSSGTAVDPPRSPGWLPACGCCNTLHRISGHTTYQLGNYLTYF